MSFWSLHDAMTEGRKWALEQERVDGSYRDLVARVADNLAERASMGRIDENLDYVWLVDAFVALHSTSPSSRERHYLRGRIDEYCSQNAVPSAVAASARAKALASIPAKTPTPWDTAEFERNAEAVRRATDDSSPAKKPKN